MHKDGALMSQSPGRGADPRKATAEGVPHLKWRREFPGDGRQLGELRRWLAGLLPECAARDDVLTVSVELATNAIKFSSSGQGGSFALEITWFGRMMRVAVADGGGPAAPHMIDDPMGDHGRGLVMVRALSSRIGVCGDHRGRLVWAEVPCAGDAAVPLQSMPDAYETAVHQDQAALARRYAGVAIWFGRRTLQWWALPGNRLLTAPSARELADLLDHVLRPEARVSQVVAENPEAARAGEQALGPAAPVPPRFHRSRSRARLLGAQPC
jgi:Histidine kinase-like ATPase domain